MTQLGVALLQTELVWHEPAQNRARLSAALASLRGPDLVLLPEMFTTGFSMASRELAEAHPGPSLDWLRSEARRLDAALAGSVMVGERGAHFNRLYFVTPDGGFRSYDKRHLFRMAGEHEHYVAGTARPTLVWRGWRICPQICYDLRFPVFSRNRREEPYDLLLYVANWPAARRAHWRTLLRARAVENLSYVAAVNRIGTDGNQVGYAGDSVLLRFDGEPLLEAGREPGVFKGVLDLAQLREYRQGFPAWLDQDDFRLADEAD